QPCTPGSAIQVQNGLDGCMTSTPEAVLYCDQNSYWQCFPADNCHSSSCSSCMAQHCSQFKSGSFPPGCGIVGAYSWIANCGPDRCFYFYSFDNGYCPPGYTINDLLACRNGYCEKSNDPIDSICSFY